MTAKEYLLDIGFDDTHLPELFNDDDKSNYQIAELMESYHQAKVKNLGLFSVSKPLPNDCGKPPKTDAEWNAMCNRIANENK